MPTNIILAHTRGGICLRPSNNIQGGYIFLCPNNSYMVSIRKFNKITIPQEVIERVTAISTYNFQPNNITFGDRNENTNPDTESPQKWYYKSEQVTKHSSKPTTETAFGLGTGTGI